MSKNDPPWKNFPKKYPYERVHGALYLRPTSKLVTF